MLALRFPQQLVGRPASLPGHQAWLCSTGSKRSKPGWLPQCPGHRLPNRTLPSRRRWCQAFGKHWPRSEMQLPVFKSSVFNENPLADCVDTCGWIAMYCIRYLPPSCHKSFATLWPPNLRFANAIPKMPSPQSPQSPQKRWHDTSFSSSVHGVQASLHAASTKGTHEPIAPKSGMTKASTPKTMPMAPITYAAGSWFEIKTRCLSSIFQIVHLQPRNHQNQVTPTVPPTSQPQKSCPPCRTASRHHSTKAVTSGRSPGFPRPYRQWNRPTVMQHTHPHYSLYRHGWSGWHGAMESARLSNSNPNPSCLWRPLSLTNPVVTQFWNMKLESASSYRHVLLQLKEPRLPKMRPPCRII